MAIFRNRLVSNQDLVLVFSACAFPIFAWSIFNVLREVPAWTLRLSIWDLVGMIAYSQVFALTETIIVFLALVLLGAILPARFFRNKFVALTSIIVFVSSMWAILAHFNEHIFGPEQLKQLLFWFGVYLLSLGICYVLVQRYEKLETRIRSFVDRLQVLSYTYVALGLVGVFIVVIRNI